MDVVKENFRDHLVLGEEGGIIGDTSSDYLWCIDPLGLSLATQCSWVITFGRMQERIIQPRKKMIF